MASDRGLQAGVMVQTELRHDGVLRSWPRIHRRFIAACYHGDLGQHGGSSESRPYAKRRRVMQGQGSDQEPTVTGVKTKDYWVHFRVPDGLMPDKQFDGRPAKLQVHRVQPEYRPGQSPSSVPAVVLIHGRTVPGPVVFDLRDPATGGGALNLSVQNALAWAGIDTFAPSLLGYGRSTRFDEGLNDPGNASLPGFGPGGICANPDPGCDRNSIPPIQPLNQQEQLLLGGHPLDAKRRHSSNFR